MYHKFGQLFAGTPTAFKEENKKSGHVTAWLDASGVQVVECEAGSKTCKKCGNLASSNTPAWVA